MANPATSGVDFAFLVAQTFGDTALEHDLLGLFVTQARQILARLPRETPGEQADSAHLLIGSARGIGAWAVAALAERYEAAGAADRSTILRALAAEIAVVEAAIETRLASGARRS